MEYVNEPALSLERVRLARSTPSWGALCTTHPSPLGTPQLRTDVSLRPSDIERWNEVGHKVKDVWFAVRLSSKVHPAARPRPDKGFMIPRPGKPAAVALPKCCDGGMHDMAQAQKKTNRHTTQGSWSTNAHVALCRTSERRAAAVRIMTKTAYG